MMKLNYMIIMGFLTALLTACMGSHENIESVDADTFEVRIQEEHQEGKQQQVVQLLDVRTPSEYADGYIEGATNLNVQQGDFLEKANAILTKERKVYVYCRSGKRSMMAATQLAKEGYQVVNLQGGIIAWSRADKPIKQ